jgi:hypothetical protein
LKKRQRKPKEMHRGGENTEKKTTENKKQERTSERWERDKIAA